MSQYLVNIKQYGSYCVAGSKAVGQVTAEQGAVDKDWGKSRGIVLIGL